MLTPQEKLHKLALMSWHDLHVQRSWSWTKQPYWSITFNSYFCSGHDSLDDCINELWDNIPETERT